MAQNLIEEKLTRNDKTTFAKLFKTNAIDAPLVEMRKQVLTEEKAITSADVNMIKDQLKTFINENGQFQVSKLTNNEKKQRREL